MRKINRFFVYIMLVAAILAHVTFLSRIAVFGARPDLALILILFFGLFFGPRSGLETGFVAGFLEDVFALDFFGINTVTMALTGLAAGIVSKKFFKESKTVWLMAVFFFTVFSMALHFIFVNFFSKATALNFSEYLFSSVIPSGIYTSLVAIPVFFKLVAFYNLKESDEFL